MTIPELQYIFVCFTLLSQSNFGVHWSDNKDTVVDTYSKTQCKLLNCGVSSQFILVTFLP